MSSVERTGTKGISLEFQPITLVPRTDKSSLAEAPLAMITEHFQVQNTAAPIMYTTPVFNIGVN